MRRTLALLSLIALAAPVAACDVPGGPGALGYRAGAFGASAAKPGARPPARRKQGHLPGELALHVLPEATDAFVLQAIDGATRSIKLQVYLLTHAGVMNGLVAAKRRGVDVQVMLEEKPFNPGNPQNPLPTNKVAAKKLAEGGVVVRWTDPTFRYTHAKALTIDDAVTYVSTANFTKSGLGVDGKGAREYIVADRSPSDVAEFVAMYAADWERRPYQPTDPDLVVSPVNSRQKIFDLVRSARRDVTIQVEVAGDPALDELIAQKLKEGVKVRALLAELKSLANQAGGPHRSNAEVAQAWKKLGADVRYQEAPHLHAKAILVDGERFYLGSVNMTTNSMDNNREIGLLVDLPDLTARMKFVLDQDFAHGHAVPEPPARKKPVRPLDAFIDFPGMPE